MSDPSRRAVLPITHDSSAVSPTRTLSGAPRTTEIADGDAHSAVSATNSTSRSVFAAANAIQLRPGQAKSATAVSATAPANHPVGTGSAGDRGTRVVAG